MDVNAACARRRKNVPVPWRQNRCRNSLINASMCSARCRAANFFPLRLPGSQVVVAEDLRCIHSPSLPLISVAHQARQSAKGGPAGQDLTRGDSACPDGAWSYMESSVTR